MENNDIEKEIKKINEEKLKEKERINKERLEVRKIIKENLKEKLNIENSILADTKIIEIYESLNVELENYLNKIETLYEIDEKDLYKMNNSTKKLEMKKNFNIILKEIFEELNIFVKIKDEYFFDGKYIVFRDAESLLIAFLIENFNKKCYPEKSFEIFLTRKKLEEFIKYFKVEENFIEKFKKEGIIEETDEGNLYIHFRDSIYTSENEPNIRKLILQNYNLKEIEKTGQKIEKYNNDTKEISKEVTFLKSSTKNINDKILFLNSSTEKLDKKINIFTNKVEEIDKKINIFTNEVEELDKKIEFLTKDIQEKSNKLEERMEKSKIEGITILGIFVGIISYLSFSFSFSKEVLSKGESLSFLISISCIGLIPIVTLILVIKLLFINPKYPLESDSFKKKLLEKCVPYLMGIFIIFLVTILVISKNFKDDYRKYISDLNKKEVVKIEKVERLEKEIEILKLRCEQQEKLILKQKGYKESNNIIFIK